MDKKLLHLGLNLGPFTPNPHTLPSELSGTMKIFEGNDVYIQILNSDYLSTSPHFQKSDSVLCQIFVNSFENLSNTYEKNKDLLIDQ